MCEYGGASRSCFQHSWLEVVVHSFRILLPLIACCGSRNSMNQSLAGRERNAALPLSPRTQPTSKLHPECRPRDAIEEMKSHHQSLFPEGCVHRLLRPVLARSKNMPSHWVSQPLAVPGRVHEDCKVPVERFHDRTIRALSWRTYKSPSKYCKAAILGSFKPTAKKFRVKSLLLGKGRRDTEGGCRSTGRNFEDVNVVLGGNIQ